MISEKTPRNVKGNAFRGVLQYFQKEKSPALCIRARGVNIVCNILDENKKSERIPDGEQVRIFHVWWTI